MKRRTVLVVLGLSGVLLLPAGCTGAAKPTPAPTHSPTAAPTPDAAKAEVVAALEKVQANAHRYEVAGGLPDNKRIKASGAVNAKARRFQSSVAVSGGEDPTSGKTLVVGNEFYVQDSPRGWVHVDLERLTPGHPFVKFTWADPVGLKKFTEAIVSAKRTAPGTYTGRFDPASADAFLPVGAPSVITLGINVSPFTVTIDEQGWVTSIVVELTPGRGDPLTMTTKLSAHGKAFTVKAPTRASEADDMNYG